MSNTRERVKDIIKHGLGYTSSRLDPVELEIFTTSVDGLVIMLLEEETKACAKIADDAQSDEPSDDYNSGYRDAGNYIAAAIRDRLKRAT